MRQMLPFEVLLLHFIDLGLIHTTIHCCSVEICSDTYVKEHRAHFSTFPCLTASSIFSSFLMTHQPSVINYRSGRGVLKHAAGCFQSRNAEDVLDLDKASGRRVPESH